MQCPDDGKMALRGLQGGLRGETLSLLTYLSQRMYREASTAAHMGSLTQLQRNPGRPATEAALEFIGGAGVGTPHIPFFPSQ